MNISQPKLRSEKFVNNDNNNNNTFLGYGRRRYMDKYYAKLLSRNRREQIKFCDEHSNSETFNLVSDSLWVNLTCFFLIPMVEIFSILVNLS